MHPNRPPTPPSYSFATDSSYVNKEHTQQIQQQQIDEYFSRNTKTPSIPTVQDFGKGIPNDQLKPDQSVYKVQFRCNRRFNYYYLSADTNIDVKINDSVIVQGDRGYDLGEVTKIIHNKQLHGCHTVKRIFRIATTEDMNSYTLLREDEAEALEFCKELIKEKELDMEVVEAEYQWDRRRLTFYYTSPEQRIDFRELVRQLFKIYKTRIWMYQINHQLKTTEFRK
ncbi:PSP1 C-terminal conserved region-domain-containing protein [Mycotypha africana]|uniref:PSP1 C-terminal conserved region-domain-containing protein n=1 Tax=Mycotypha africana TaxID=64632 RepID=UPI0023011560|nr:PSP1 C-terminal conserved region-domain-containing protein [Mycotypha africana]KAI8973435.1 PSP1 C-terminal conserved region-domain-containing protein [Mycotypha africana]